MSTPNSNPNRDQSQSSSLNRASLGRSQLEPGTFFVVFNHAMASLSELKRSELCVYILLCSMADGQTRKSFPRQQTIAARCGQSERATREALRGLKSRGLIRIEKRLNQSNLYQIVAEDGPEMKHLPAGSGVPSDRKQVAAKQEPTTTNNKMNVGSLGSEMQSSWDSPASSDYQEAFQAWIKVYPKREAIQRAWLAYNQAIQKLVNQTTTLTHSDIKNAWQACEFLNEQAKAYGQKVEGIERKYILTPANWLNDERFDDVYGNDEVEMSVASDQQLTAAGFTVLYDN